MDIAHDGVDWIICLSSERSILHGMVECPRQDGRAVPISDCHDCRLLEYARSERDRPDPCSAESEAEPRLG
jgi:hypothetical protein